MRSKDLALEIGCSAQHIRLLTKKAAESGKSYVDIKGRRVFFVAMTGASVGRGGVVYEYSLSSPVATVRKRRRGESRVDIAALKGLGVDVMNPQFEDRVRVVQYVAAHPEYSVGAVAIGFGILLGKEEYAKSIERKIRRWIKAYRDGGKEALMDRRGGSRGSAVDRDMFLKSIVKRGGLKSYYLRYCAMWCEREGMELDIWEPRSNVSYSGFVKYFHRCKNDAEVKMLLRGMDAVEESLPVFSTVAQMSYPNQRWEIDATRIDMMVKIPLVNGEPEYFRVVESDEYIVGRYTLNGLVDVYSGARVYKLMKSGTSYGNARLLEKAIGALGVPEMIKGDNGKDYASKHFQDVLEDLGIVYEAATPYKGSEKGSVERGFRTLQHDARFEVLPGYIGHSIKERQQIESQAVKKSQRGGKGVQTNLKDKLLWWWEAERALDGLINGIFEEQMKLHASLRQESRGIPDLHYKLGKKGQRRLQRTGVQWNGKIYTSVALWQHYRVGDMVTVREEIDDISTLYVEDERGGYIALTSDRSAISLEEAQEAKRSYRKRHTAKVKQIIKSAKSEAAKLSELTVAALESRSAIIEPEIIRIQKATNQKPSSRAEEMMGEIMKAAGY